MSQLQACVVASLFLKAKLPPHRGADCLPSKEWRFFADLIGGPPLLQCISLKKKRRMPEYQHAPL